MTTSEGADTTFDAELAGLSVRDARPERVAEIRAAWLAALERTRGHRTSLRSMHWSGMLETSAAAGLALLSLAAAVERALQILR